ncbi:MAG: pyridoxine 5'-phosphate synthase [Tepidisphaeraceae bacterium]
MARLSVNVNKIATLRNTRALDIPNVVRLAQLALEAGAAGITVHPRPDERHIRPADVNDLAQLLKRYPHAEYNIEGNPFHGLVEHCRRVKPTQATLVPDAEGQSTSDHGFALGTMTEVEQNRLRDVIQELQSIGCRVSLFMDPDAPLMGMAKLLGADRVELYTEPYASACAAGCQEAGVKPYIDAAREARTLGLGVNAGHDLNLDNLQPFLGAVEGVDEVSIGHALIADALEFGMKAAVRKYLDLCN